MFKLSAFNLLKALSPLAIAASIFVATEAPAEAVPRIYVPSSRHHSGYSRSRRVAPSSLNVTPLPGRHIPLPRSSRHYDRRYHDRYRSRYDNYDRRYDRRYRDRDYDRKYDRRYRDRDYDRKYDRRYRDRDYDRYDRDGRVYRRRIIITPVLKY